MVRIKEARPVGGFRAHLVFTDGSEKEVDLEPLLVGPAFDPIRENAESFEAFAVDPELGALVWPNGADICPDVLYHDRPLATANDDSQQLVETTSTG